MVGSRRLVLKKSAIVGLVALSSVALPQALGTWAEVNFPNGYYIRGIHLILLPDARVLIWDNGYQFGQPLPDTPRLTVVQPGKNYTYDEFTVGGAPNTTTNLFCAGHTFLEDGRLFVAGGHKFENFYGDDRINVFNWQNNPSNAWITSPNVMTQYRWYPSVTYLPDRRILITGGVGGPGHAASYIPDMWAVDVPWENTPLKDFHSALPLNGNMNAYYPFWFVDPKDGNLFLANRGKSDEAVPPNQKYNLATLQMSNYAALPNQDMNVREQYSSGAMINAKNDNGVREAIVILSGGAKSGEETFSTKSALFCNLLDPNPSFASAQDMNFARQCHTLIALPTGDVVAFGGSDRFGPSGKPYLSEALPRTAPELWNAMATDKAMRPWKLLAQPSQLIPRGYHSTSVLLPDGRIMNSGGEPEGFPAGSGYEWQWVSQFFSPPYGGRADWASRRPDLISVPSIIRYGEAFNITMAPNGASQRPIKRLMLCSPGPVTHAISGRQEIYELDFAQVSGNIYRVTPPAATKHATPGYYMLFAVDDTDDGPQGETRIKGIPSFAKWVQLKDFEQIFVTGGQVLRGSPDTMIDWQRPSDLLLADNIYLGTQIRYAPGFTGSTVEVQFEGDAVATSAAKVRLSLQLKASGQAAMRVYFKKRGTGAWAQIGPSHSVGIAEQNYEIVASNDDLLGPNGEITAKIDFKQTAPSFSSPSVKIDLADVGIR